MFPTFSSRGFHIDRSDRAADEATAATAGRRSPRTYLTEACLLVVTIVAVGLGVCGNAHLTSTLEAPSSLVAPTYLVGESEYDAFFPDEFP